MDSQQRQRLLRSSITSEERKRVSLILAGQIDEALKEVDPRLMVATLVKFAILFKAMYEEGEFGPHANASVDTDLQALGIKEIIDDYVAHRPEEIDSDG